MLTEDEPENNWYFSMLKNDLEYSVNVDNDEVNGADNAITVFVNCKIFGPDEDFLGVVGVGMRVSYLKEFLKEYEEKYHLNACLVDGDGKIEISSEHTGYNKTDWFEICGGDSRPGSGMEGGLFQPGIVDENGGGRSGEELYCVQVYTRIDLAFDCGTE